MITHYTGKKQAGSAFYSFKSCSKTAATNKNVKFNCPLRPYEQEKLKKVHFSFAIVLCDMQMQLTSIPLSL